MRKLALATVAAFALLAAPAVAYDYGAYLKAANAYWHAESAACQPRFVFWALDNFQAREEVAARGEASSCTIWIYTGNTEYQTAYVACLIIVHERGHTLGYGHTADGGIMDPVADERVNVPQCHALTDPKPKPKRPKPKPKRRKRHRGR